MNIPSLRASLIIFFLLFGICKIRMILLTVILHFNDAYGKLLPPGRSMYVVNCLRYKTVFVISQERHRECQWPITNTRGYQDFTGIFSSLTINTSSRNLTPLKPGLRLIWRNQSFYRSWRAIGENLHLTDCYVGLYQLAYIVGRMF